MKKELNMKINKGSSLTSVHFAMVDWHISTSWLTDTFLKSLSAWQLGECTNTMFLTCMFYVFWQYFKCWISVTMFSCIHCVADKSPLHFITNILIMTSVLYMHVGTSTSVDYFPPPWHSLRPCMIFSLFHGRHTTVHTVQVHLSMFLLYLRM